MSVSERERHNLYEKARRLLGDEDGETLMSMLPGVGWADVATKHDLDTMSERLDLRFGALEERLDLRFGALEAGLRAEMHRELRDQTARFIGWMFAAVGISSTIAGGIAALG